MKVSNQKVMVNKYSSRGLAYVGALVAAIAMQSSVVAAPVVFQDIGPTGGDIQATVDAFSTALGSPLNGSLLGPLAGGRRGINWDGPDSVVPFDLPGNTFNSPPVTRGVELSTPGTGFRVSNDAGGIDVEFDSFNANYPGEFTTFSSPRLFSPVGSNVVDVNFFVPGSSAPATVSGFGAVFTDVDTPVSRIEYFDENDSFISSTTVLTQDKGLSFLGVIFDAGERIGRVRITLGNSALGPNDDASGNVDVVVLDDFFYSEPAALPEPTSIGLVLIGLGALATRRRVAA